VISVLTSTHRLDYIVVTIESEDASSYGPVFCNHNFTPYELRPVELVRALASLDEGRTKL